MLSVARNRKQYLLEDVLVVGICEGLRRNEFFNLQWRHVDEKRRLMTLRDTKILRDNLGERERRSG
jgi:integrase